MTLEFDATTHTYALGGKVLPSVSQIIQADGKLSEWMDKINPDVLAAKSANGTNVHDYLARWDSSEGMEEYAPFAGYLGAWLKFKNEHMPAGNGSYIEIPLAHPTLQFAGTPDRVYFNRETKSRIIVDIKTGKASASHSIQTAGYAYLVAYMVDPDNPTVNGTNTKRMAVYLDETGGHRVVPHTDPDDYTAFMSLRNLYFWKKRNGLVK